MKFKEKHDSYINNCYVLVGMLGFLYWIFRGIQVLWLAVVNGDFLLFAFVVVCGSIILIPLTMITTMVWGTVLMVVGFIPYLAIKWLKDV